APHLDRLRRSRIEGGAVAGGYRCRIPTAPACSGASWGGHGTPERTERLRGSIRMSLLPDVDRILLGPGPSLTAPRVMRAMAAPTISHLDPLMLALLDDARERLLGVFWARHG